MPKNKGQRGKMQTGPNALNQEQIRQQQILEAKAQKFTMLMGLTRNMLEPLPVDVSEKQMDAYMKTIKKLLSKVEYLFHEQMFGESVAMKIRAKESGIDISQTGPREL